MLGRAATIGLLAVFAVGCQTAGGPSQTNTVATEPMSGPATPATTTKPATEQTVQPAVQQQTANSSGAQEVQPAVAETTEAELVFLDFSGFDEDLSREMSEDEAADRGRCTGGVQSERRSGAAR